MQLPPLVAKKYNPVSHRVEMAFYDRYVKTLPCGGAGNAGSLMSSCAAEQFHRDVSLEADEHRTIRKIISGRRKVTSVHDDRHLLRMAVNDRTASSRQLAARWSTTTDVLMLTLSIRRRLLHRGLRSRLPLYRISFAANHRRLRLQWAHEHRAWQAD
ncbi:transposable element Tcb2 transposase [Trichonephila clavipes]|nr:transposable element Tcb2 transposase [Trichonephila clavipes]